MSRRSLVALLCALTLIAAACGGDEGTLTVYSGRSEELVAPLIAQFEEETGIEIEVRYGDSAELAATLLEEGENSPADVFFAQDPASLGTVRLGGLLADLDQGTLAMVPPRFSDTEGKWIGVSGRARVVVYDASVIAGDSLPESEDGLATADWAGRVAVAPTNGSFLAFVAAKILIDGEDRTLAWLRTMADNGAPTYPSNSVIVTAVDTGEVEAGLVNHYYLFRRIAEEGDGVVAANDFMTGGGAGSLVMPAGVGVLASTDVRTDADAFVDFMLSVPAQQYFADETFEYPLIAGVAANPSLPSLASLNPPDISLSDLASVLDRATDLVAEAGLL